MRLLHHNMVAAVNDLDDVEFVRLETAIVMYQNTLLQRLDQTLTLGSVSSSGSSSGSSSSSSEQLRQQRL